MAMYLAFDVGGTKTACVLADDERILARAHGGSIKTLRISGGEAVRHLDDVLGQIVAQTGADLREVVRTCIGTSGVSAPAVRDWMRRELAARVGGELVLLGDEVIAVDAAFPGERGALVIAGTGSNIVGRAATGEMTHTGGWGPALADEGSGHWIGYNALRACFAAIDAAAPSSADAVDGGVWGEASSPVSAHAASKRAPRRDGLPVLLRMFMDELRVDSLDALIGGANNAAFDFARLVPVVVAASRGGDGIAAEILRRAGEDLARLVTQVIGKMEVLEEAAGVGPFPAPESIAFIGGVLTNIPEVHSATQAMLGARFPGMVLQEKPTDALNGALWHARRRQVVTA